jgi:nitric oxide reductase activation protein
MAARTALNKSRQLGAQLAGLFAAHNAKHCGGQENGQRLNRHRLHLLAVNTPDIRVFVDNQQRKAENTAIALLIDASGSMAEHIDLAVHAAYVVAKCLQNLKGIATTVAAFPYGDDEHVLEVKSFNLPPVFDRFGQVYANNNTPTAEVVMWGIQRLFPRKEERKIMIIFTDGRPNSYTSAQRAVKKAMELGIEVYVIALNDSTKGKNKGFIDENLISPIARIEDLGSAIINLLRSALIKRAA